MIFRGAENVLQMHWKTKLKSSFCDFAINLLEFALENKCKIMLKSCTTMLKYCKNCKNTANYCKNNVTILYNMGKWGFPLQRAGNGGFPFQGGKRGISTSARGISTSDPKKQIPMGRTTGGVSKNISHAC